jgi:hypothetical protein
MAIDFSGAWLSNYSYHEGEDNSQHIVTFEGGTEIAGRSLVQPDGSELLLRLTHDAESNTLTGTWHETTSPAGPYKGRVFHGVLQLILNEVGDKAEGKWLGYNSNVTHVNTGNWKLEKKQQ